MFQSGQQNSNRRCACSTRNPQTQKNGNCQVSFDCDRIFGETKSRAPRCDHGGSNSCEFCPIRQMCDDILSDIKRWKCKMKKKKNQEYECSSPIQRQDSLPDDVKELYKCTGMSSDPKKVDSDYPLCDDFVRILKCLANSPSPKKSGRKKSTDLCSYVCDYHAQDLERGSSLELCNPNAHRNKKGDKDKNQSELEDPKSVQKGDSKKKKNKKSDKDKNKEKSSSKMKSKEKSYSDDDASDKDKENKDKNRDNSKDKNRNKKDKDKDDNDRLKGGREKDEDDTKPTKKPQKPPPQRFEPSDRQKAGAQKPATEKQKDDLNEKEAGKAKRCEYRRGKSGKECDVELNKAVGRKITDNMRLRLEQFDLKRMNQNRCVSVPVCDPCLICPPCETILPCDPCAY